MKPIFFDSAKVEKSAKELYSIPENLMMENAAANLEIVLNSVCENMISPKIFIACGKGNNGADGIALARRIHGKMNCKVLLLGEPKTTEAKTQFKMAKAIGVEFISFREFVTGIESAKKVLKKNSCQNDTVIIDCIFGTGFHGQLDEETASLIQAMNEAFALRIACDIPSALAFNADYTVTMGALKSKLFSDNAKNKTGEILIADLGISPVNFEKCGKPEMFLIEKDDMVLPYRKDKASHKGKFGHATVFTGEKAGAGILAANAALNFGSGLVSLVKTDCSNIEQFKISPQLMVSTSIPKKTTSICLGSGLGKVQSMENPIIQQFLDWFKSAKNPACVLDADILTSPIIPELLTELNKIEDARIVLTPHPQELCTLTELTCLFDFQFTNDKITDIDDESQKPVRVLIAEKLIEKFPKITLLMKGANTIIASKSDYFVVADGNPSLAKAGSGDILAGLICGLLAQGYDAQNAAITACEAHALASGKSDSFSLTSEDLIQNLKAF